MSDDNIVQTEIDLDAIEAETERRVEKHRLHSALPNTDDNSISDEEVPIPKGSVIKLNQVDNELEQLSTFWDEPPASFRTHSKPQNDWEWQQWDSDEPEDPVNLTDDWNGDINEVYNDYQVDDDDTYKQGTRWDNKNHCWVTDNKKLAAARWWDNQTDETEIMAEVLQKIEEAGVQVNHLSTELSGLENVVDEVSSTTTYVSKIVSKTAKDVAVLKKEMVQLKQDVRNATEYLKILVTHFIEEETNSSN